MRIICEVNGVGVGNQYRGGRPSTLVERGKTSYTNAIRPCATCCPIIGSTRALESSYIDHNTLCCVNIGLPSILD